MPDTVIRLVLTVVCGYWNMPEGFICLSLHCHHHNDSCIKMGSDESHCNILLNVRFKVTRQCPQTTAFLKRKESRSRIEPKPICLPVCRLTARPNRLYVVTETCQIEWSTWYSCMQLLKHARYSHPLGTSVCSYWNMPDIGIHLVQLCMVTETRHNYIVIHLV